MNIQQVLDKYEAIMDGDPSHQDVMQAVTEITSADDLTANERDSIQVGYLMGLMFSALTDRPGIGTELLLRLHEWDM